MTRAPINRIVPFSAVDGPGNRTAVFTQGCSFACTYCHNPETIHTCVQCGKCVSVCPTNALSVRDGRVRYDHTRCVLCDACIKVCEHLSCPRIREMNAEEVMQEVHKNMPFIRGITVSGGECTLQRDFLMELSPLAHAEGLDFLLDSNGSYDFAEDPDLLQAVDGVMLDIKEWDDEAHRKLTGKSAELPRKNLETLLRHNKLTEVRTVVLTQDTNPEATIRNAAETIVRYERRDVRYKIIAFRPMGVREPYKAMSSPSSEFLQSLKAVAEKAGLTDIVLI